MQKRTTNMTDSTHDFFVILAKILLRCWIFGLLLLVFWAGVFLLASEAIHNLHGPMFGLSPHDLNLIYYSCMAFVKLVVILFFFFPWLAIRLVLRKTKG